MFSISKWSGYKVGNDIFEDMRRRLNCAYVSDLKYYREKVMLELHRMTVSDYQSQNITDLVDYVSQGAYTSK